MKPYFETENGRLYHGDCLEIMPKLEAVDLVLTDPPYGLNYDKNASLKSGQQYGNACAPKGDYGVTGWDEDIPSKECFNLLIKKSNNQIIFGAEHICLNLPKSRGWIVWDKKTGDNNFSDCELLWTSFSKPIKKYEYMWNGMLQENKGKYKEKRYHPTQKPVGLLKQILLKYSEENQTILDPFFGSGSTGLACEELNRKWIGIEISEEYCEIAARRIEKETQQLKLFKCNN